MRHNDARKWLHAILDLLPVLLIPVFMIYSHRHTLTERTNVDIQYKYQSNEVNIASDLVEGNIYHFDEFIFEYDYDDLAFTLNLVTCEYFEINGGSYGDFVDFDIYYFLNNNNCEIGVTLYQTYLDVQIYSLNGDYLSYFDTNISGEYEVTFYNFNASINNLSNFLSYTNIQGISLPTYTDYNIIESVDVQDTNTSVMNVFMDNFNTAIDKYFNMGNVFNLNGVYQWFNTNIFGGNAPTIIYSVWNIALYELVMDLLFLLYGLFMWFIDICKHLMDKPFRSIK